MKQQQTQMEMMLKQIQAQMESEMRMKSELVNFYDFNYSTSIMKLGIK
jgi:hypothetical protein